MRLTWEMALAISKQKTVLVQAQKNYLKLVASCFNRRFCDILGEGSALLHAAMAF